MLLKNIRFQSIGGSSLQLYLNYFNNYYCPGFISQSTKLLNLFLSSTSSYSPPLLRNNWFHVKKSIYKCFSIKQQPQKYLKIKSTIMEYNWNNLPKPNVIFVLGGPGAGKGTMCKLINQEFGYVHLSAGDLLREEQNRPDSEYGKLIADHIKNGTIVPVEITCRLLMNAMLEKMIELAQNNANKSDGDNSKTIPKGNFLIDGFPRNQDNLDGWKKFVDDKVNLQFVLFFECPQEIYVERCLKRGQHSGRADDNPESIKKRLQTYLNQTMPIVEYYDKLNLVKRIDGSRTIDEVYADVRQLLIDINKSSEN